MKIKTIDIQGKEWFDRVNGNSYCSSLVTINFGMKTEKQFSMPYEYGYGSYYQQAALAELVKRNLIPTRETYALREKHGIILRSSIETKCRKRDVVAYGDSKREVTA